MSFRNHLSPIVLALAGGLIGAGIGHADVVPVGPEITVNTFLTGDQTACDVSSSGDGTTVYVWQSEGQDGSSSGIFGRVSTSATEFDVNTFTTGAQTDPAVSHWSDGAFVVVWVTESPNPGQMGVFGQRFRPNGTKDGNELFIRVANATMAEPDVSVSPDGTFVVVWREGAIGSWGIWSRRLNANGNPIGGSIELAPVAGVPTGPAVSHNTLGDTVIVWGKASGGSSPWAAEAIGFDAGGNLLFTLDPINTTAFGAIYDVDISHAPNGDFVVVWSGQGSTTTFRDVFGRRHDINGVPQGNDFLVNSDVAGMQTEPAVDHGADGGFVVVWEGPTAVWGRCFDAAGTANGSDFGVNFSSDPPALAFYDDDEFSVGWSWIPTTVDEDIQGRSYRITTVTGVEPVAAGAIALSVQARPTVFRERSTIRLAIPQTGPVAVRIADVRGRIVRTLVDRSIGAGVHEVVWDGRDGSGRSVAAGVYFYHLRAGAAERTGRLVRIR